jgi:hypothetical protein
MSTPDEHKTQARFLAYAEAIGWMVVSRIGSNGPTTQTEVQ